VFSVHYDLARRRDHERRHHGRRLLPEQRRTAARRGWCDGGHRGGQLRGHGVYGRVPGRLCRMRRCAARLETACGPVSHHLDYVVQAMPVASPGASNVFLRTLPLVAIPEKERVVEVKELTSCVHHKGGVELSTAGSCTDVGRGHYTWTSRFSPMQEQQSLLPESPYGCPDIIVSTRTLYHFAVGVTNAHVKSFDANNTKARPLLLRTLAIGSKLYSVY
jgi:hypothetical protein